MSLLLCCSLSAGYSAAPAALAPNRSHTEFSHTEFSAALERATSSAWQPLRDQLEAWKFTDDFAVTIGTANAGRIFSYTHGDFTLHTRVETASTSKWPSAMMLVGLVHDGTIRSLDARACEYLEWWTCDPRDQKSRVTLAHLLSFTSGFGGGAPGLAGKARVRSAGKGGALSAGKARALSAGKARALSDAPPDEASCLGSKTADFMHCAKTIYTSTERLEGEPGTVYSYNSNHLQLAGAVAVAASGLSIAQVIDKYLLQPYAMHGSRCETPSAQNPMLAACLTTTAADYERFLRATLGHAVLSRSLVAESERDHTPFMAQQYTLYGDYGFGHFLECFDSVDGSTERCKAAAVHCDPGAFGFYPLIDRRHGYYMQVVAYEHGDNYPRSGIPEYLRLLIKPIVDAIARGEDLSFAAGHHKPELLGLSLADVNYIAGCYTDPKSCE